MHFSLLVLLLFAFLPLYFGALFWHFLFMIHCCFTHQKKKKDLISGHHFIPSQANEMLHHKANLNGYLSYHTGQSLEKINQDTDRDFFMSAKEAKEYGLIDGVILNPLKALKPLVATADQ